jgi:hypothetical protein
VGDAALVAHLRWAPSSPCAAAAFPWSRVVGLDCVPGDALSAG